MAQKLAQRLVQTAHPYLYSRGRFYYFRLIIPESHRSLVSGLPKEIRHSLRTSRLEKALPIVRRQAELVDDLRLACTADQLKSLYDSLLSGFENTSMPTLALSQSSCSKTLHSLTVNSAWKEYLASRRWTERRVYTNGLMFENVSVFIGERAVSTLTKRDIAECLKRIEQLPRRNLKRYMGKPIIRLAEMHIPEEDRISRKTVREHLKLMQSLFSGYLVRDMELLDKSPTDGVSYVFEDYRFGTLTDTQLKEALIRGRSKPRWFQVLLTLAVYSGARRSELASLTKDDIAVCLDTGLHYFLVRRGKTASAVRRVPLHKAIIASGFLDFVDASSGELFPQAKKNPNRVTDIFNSLMLENRSEFGERLVFHSIRHTFITKLRSKSVELALVQELVGHRKTGGGITDRYTHRFDLVDLANAVDSFQID